ncbi:hypothetical protein ACWJJH_22540 [Endozoicomonadaceae bacterium StTr2]
MDAPQGFQLNIPQTQAGSLSFAQPEPKAVAAWAKALPKANLGEMAKQVFQALKELNQITIPAAKRVELLEQIRPATHYVVKQMRQQVLKLSINLNQQQTRAAALMQALYAQLIIGYKLAISELVSTPKAPQLGLALHRALSDASHQLLLSCRLYRPAPKGHWLELHTLYQIASASKLTKQAVEDPEQRYVAKPEIQHCYIRALLLHACSPYQLRPRQVRYLFEALEHWSTAATIESDASQSVFSVPIAIDHAPEYASLNLHPDTPAIGLETTQLAKLLDEAGKDKDAAKLPVPDNINDLILNHVCLMLEGNHHRQHKRQIMNGSIDVIDGMSAVHFHLADSTDFDHFVIADTQDNKQQEKTEFKEQSNDAWANVHDADSVEKNLPGSEQPLQFTGTSAAQSKSCDYPVHSASIINISPSGYCLSWAGDVPSHIQNGEVIGVREDANDNWNLAIIRWIKVESEQQTLTGIELMAPNVRPAAAAMLHKHQDSTQYMRCFVLPESPALALPASLILPTLPFRSGCKLLLQDQQQITKAQLSQCMLSTASFNRFEFKTLGQIASTEVNSKDNNPPTAEPSEGGDSWTLL